MIGDRINPGFKSTKTLLDDEDIAGVQALAVRQVEAGASALDVTIGPRAVDRPRIFLARGRARHPGGRAGAALLRFPERAGAGGLPEDLRPRARRRRAALDQFDHRTALGHHGPLQRLRPVQSHRHGVRTHGRRRRQAEQDRRRKSPPPPNARPCVCNRITAWRWTTSISISRSAPWSPTPTACTARPWTQCARCTTIRSSRGLHIMGGLTNIGQQLPPKAADGSDLKLSLECAFLTLAVPLGFDTDPVHAVARTVIRCRTTITFLPPTRIFSSRPAATRYARYASYTGLEAIRKIPDPHRAKPQAYHERSGYGRRSARGALRRSDYRAPALSSFASGLAPGETRHNSARN